MQRVNTTVLEKNSHALKCLGMQGVDSTFLLEPLLKSPADFTEADAASKAALVFVGHTVCCKSLFACLCPLSPELVQVCKCFLLMQMRLQDLSASTTGSAVKPLRDVIKSAQHSVSMPSFLHEVCW